MFVESFLDGDATNIVLATGDYVINGNGDTPPWPLQAPLLIATYEKYLALLSASGIPETLGNTVVVCDEIQLIGDANRGQNVEILLTLLKNAGWKQLVALSAVLEDRDAKELANWLNVKAVISKHREKHLNYEFWADAGISSSTTASSTAIKTSARPKGVTLDVLSIIQHLKADKKKHLPIIVFCMRKQDMYDYSAQLLAIVTPPGQKQLSLEFSDLPETTANNFLSEALEQRIAIHSA